MLKQFNSNTKKLNRIIPKINTNNLMDSDLTGSLLNIEIPTSTSHQSHTRSNPNPIKLVSNKNKISDFYNEILQFGGRSIRKSVDEFSNSGYGSLIIHSASLDYGTEGASFENFEIMVYGLHIPGDYRVYEQNGNVVVSLNDSYIDFDNVTVDDIYVIGKFK